MQLCSGAKCDAVPVRVIRPASRAHTQAVFAAAVAVAVVAVAAVDRLV